MINYRIQTIIDGDNIVQSNSVLMDDIIQQLPKQVIDTSEQQIRAALIKLGWTPPVSSGGRRRTPLMIG